MAVHRITLGDDDLELLTEGRHDLLTQEPLRYGDVVVACVGCNTIHLASSWDSYGKCTNCNNTNTRSTLPPRARTLVITEPKIVKFVAVPDEILAGQSIQLNWRTEHADYAYLDDRPVDINGEAIFIPERPTTYQFRVENRRGNRSAISRVQLFTPKILGFASDTNEIEDGQTVRLSFDLENAVGWEINAYYNAVGNQPIRIGSGCNNNLHPNTRWRDTLTFKPSGGVSLQLIAQNGSELDRSHTIRLIAKELEVLAFDADKLIAPVGAPVKLRWAVKNAYRITIDNNIGDVTGRDFVEFTPASERDITLKLTAEGPFNRTVTKELLLRIARFENLRPENNGDVKNPRFYIRYDGFNISQGSVKIYPGGHYVSDSGRILIDAAEDHTEYTIEAQTSYGDKVSSTVSLEPVRIFDFGLRNNLALVGSPAELQWTTHNSRRLMLEHVGDVTGLDRVQFTVQEHHKVISFYAWGDCNLQTRTLTMPIYKSPRLESIKVPTLYLDVRFTLNVPIGSMPRFPALYSRRGYDRAEIYRRELNLPQIIQWMIVPSEVAFTMMKRAKSLYRYASRRMNVMTKNILQNIRAFNRNTAKWLFSQIKFELNNRRNGQNNEPPDNAPESL